MKWLVSLLFAVSLLSARVAPGQSDSAQSPRENVIRSFDRKSPEVGQQLPDIKAYNAAGETLRLGELKGAYTVLVFGCLT